MNKTHKNCNKCKNRTINHRQLGNNGIKKKCIDTLVKSRMERYNKLTMEVFNEKEKLYRKILKNKYSLKEDKENAKKSLKRIRKERKSRKGIKIQEKTDSNIFCNPGCKGTLLEPGNKLSSEFYKKYKDSKEMIKILEEDRNKLFSNKNNILLDNFYEKAPKKFVDEIKKKGGISLCAPIEKFYW
jgi:hypothetical protein